MSSMEPARCSKGGDRATLFACIRKTVYITDHTVTPGACGGLVDSLDLLTALVPPGTIHCTAREWNVGVIHFSSYVRSARFSRCCSCLQAAV